MGNKRILVIDDSPTIHEGLKCVLLKHLGPLSKEIEVLSAYDGQQGLEYIDRYKADLVILDVQMPRMDGIEMLRQMRSDKRAMNIPVIVLTASVNEELYIESLDIGADDYLTKKVAKPAVLCAHVRARLRERRDLFTPLDASVLRYADIEANVQTRAVYRGPDKLELTPRKFDLLVCFLRHPHQVLSRDSIIEHAWGFSFEGSNANVDVYVGYLRQKLEASGKPRVIQTVRGIGYVLKEKE